jgi:CrcB protein
LTRSPSRRARATTVLAIACGGAAGALARYAITTAIPTRPGHIPWGTLLINVSGSAVLGFLLVVIAERIPGDRLARPVLGTGMIGAYTTFSTLAVESVLLGRDGRALTAVAYVLMSLILGLIAVAMGTLAARAVLSAERLRAHR